MKFAQAIKLDRKSGVVERPAVSFPYSRLSLLKAGVLTQHLTALTALTAHLPQRKYGRLYAHNALSAHPPQNSATPQVTATY